MERDPKIAVPKPPKDRANACDQDAPSSTQSWIGRAWAQLTAAIVQDLPAILNECESCRETDCTRRQWELCPRRQRALVALTCGPGTPSPIRS